MNADANNRNLDELISRAIGRDKPNFDFDKWKQNHRKQIDVFRTQQKAERTTLATFELNMRTMTLWRKAGYVAAALLVVSSWVVCFVLWSNVANLKDELERARRVAALAPVPDSATINFYLEEHRDLVARHAAFSVPTPQPAQMRVSPQDILYYEFFDDEPQYLHPGIIVRGRSSQQPISPPEAPAISNGHTLSLSEARQTADFDLQAPARFYPGYSLDQIRRIEGRDAIGLLYTDGINSISLFEQPLDGQRGLEPQDFREYAVYRNKGQAGGTILAWRDNALSYVLIGNAEMSQLMDMAHQISAGK